LGTKVRQSIVAANWKMYGSQKANEALVTALRGELTESNDCAVVICPPHIYLQQVADLLAGSAMALGGQDVSASEPGAYTGDIAATMLTDVGCQYVIVGHSERRQGHGESDVAVAMKFAQAKQHGLQPILCVGETAKQREAGQTLEVINHQLAALLQLSAGVEQFSNAVVAYEPIWAIGTGNTASPEQAQEVHQAIRAIIADKSVQIAEQLPIIYGGSVKANNAQALFAQADIDGALVGGASLIAEEFVEIIRCIK